MSTSYTSLLGFALPATGELSGTWGDTVNNSITTLLDSAIAGTTTIVLDQDVTLSSNDGTADTSRQAIILWTAGGSATRTITAPGQSKIYTVINASSGTQSIILNALTTTGVTIAKGESALVAWNGSDFIKISNTAGPGTFTDLTVTGNTTLGNAVSDTITVNSQFVTGTVLRSAQALTNTLSLAAYDVDGTAYTNLITLTASNTPTLALTSTGVGTINNMSIGATTASTGAFTTLTSNGATTFTAGTASTTTGTGTLVITGGLGVSGRINAANFDGIVGANTAAAGSFTTLSTSGLLSANANLKVVNGANDFGTIQLGTSASYVFTGGATYSGYRFETPTGTQYDFQVNATSRALINGTGLAVTGTFSSTLGATIQGLTVGLGAGAVATNTAVGASALAANTSGAQNTTVGNQAGATTNAAYLTAVGYQAARYNTGDGNTAIGTNALLVSSGTGGTGSNNTAIGKDSLYQNTSASNNTAVGYQAGYTNQTGAQLTAFGVQAGYTNNANNNAFFGYQAGYKNASGTNNAAFGAYRPLYENVSGNFNTAIGDQALNKSTGSNNTAVGYVAGFNTTTGPNTFVGAYAGYYTTSGTGNTALGYGALTYGIATGFSTGSSNTAIGDSALYALSSGSSNTAVGYQAGYTTQTGARNTFFGEGAGYLTTSSFNAFIGNHAGYNTTGGSNTFVGDYSGYLVESGAKNTIIGKFDGNSSGLDITAASNYIVLSDGDGNPRMYWNNTTWYFQTLGAGAGTNALKWNTSNGAITYDTSSARYKDNIRDSVYGLSHVMQMRSAQFEYKDTGRSDVGLIAEELDPIIPELVMKNKDGEPDAVSYDRMVSVLVKAIQELKAEVDSLKSQLNGA